MSLALRTAVIAAAVFTLAPVFAWPDPADDARLSATFHACLDRAQGANASMRACINAEQDRLESRLNEVYRDLMTTMQDGGAKETLRNSERAWITHRETECQFEGSQVESGTVKPVIVSGCWLKQTADRVDELQKRRDFEKRWK